MDSLNFYEQIKMLYTPDLTLIEDGQVCQACVAFAPRILLRMNDGNFVFVISPEAYLIKPDGSVWKNEDFDNSDTYRELETNPRADFMNYFEKIRALYTFDMTVEGMPVCARYLPVVIGFIHASGSYVLVRDELAFLVMPNGSVHRTDHFTAPVDNYKQINPEGDADFQRMLPKQKQY